MNRILGPGLLVCVMSLACCTQIRAQPIDVQAGNAEPPDNDTASDLGVDSPVIEKQGPPITLYFRDGENLVAQVFTMQEWGRIFSIFQGQEHAGEPSRVLLTELHLDMTIEGDVAQIGVKLNVKSRVDGWQLIPFGVGEAHWIEQPLVNQTNDAATLHFNGDWNGYELSMRTEANKTYEVEFSLRTRVHKIGVASQVQLSLPRPAASSLRAELPGTNQVVTVSETTLLTQDESSESTTNLTLQGLAPDFVISWQPQESDTPQDRSFEAQTAIDVRVNSNDTVTSEVEISLTSYGRPSSRYNVLAPESLQILNNDPDVQFRRVGTVEGRQELEFDFGIPLKDPVLRFAVAFPQNQEFVYQLAGYEVVGAIRQSGMIRINSQSKSRLDIQPGKNARRVSERDASRQSYATFEFSQPNQIELHVSPRREESEITVEPIYILDIQEAEANLTAIFRYTARGEAPTTVFVKLGSWSWRPMPGGRQADVRLGESLEVPIFATSNEFSVRINARKFLPTPLSQEPTLLTFELPVPEKYDRLLQSTIVVNTASRIAVDPSGVINKEFVGASVPEVAMNELSGDPTQMPHCFRSRNQARPPDFTVSARALEQSIDVNCRSEVIQVTGGDMIIRQTMLWKIDNVPLPQATLMVNGKIKREGSLRVSVNREPVAPVSTPITFDAGEDTPINIRLPRPAVGTFEITIDYEVPLEDSDVSSTNFNLPLVYPVKMEGLRFKHQFLSPLGTGYQFTLAEELAWTKEIEISDAVEDAVLASTTEFVPTIPLQLERVQLTESTQELVIIDRMWLQSWFTKTHREDRAVFHVLGPVPDLKVSTPPSVEGKDLYVLVNGVRQKTAVPRDGFVVVEVKDATRESHVIEIIYPKVTRDPPGRLTLAVPHISRQRSRAQEKGSKVIGLWYWHVVMPRSECLVAAPAQLTSDQPNFASLWKPDRDIQTDLEDWSMATRTQRSVLRGSSEYLFGALGEVDNPVIHTTTLPLYVLLVGGTVFVIGLLLVYAQKGRSVLLVLIGIGLLATYAINPTFAAAAGRTAALGLVLVCLASLLSWLTRNSNQQALPRTSLATVEGRRATLSADTGGRHPGGSTALSTGSSRQARIELADR